MPGPQISERGLPASRTLRKSQSAKRWCALETEGELEDIPFLGIVDQHLMGTSEA